MEVVTDKKSEKLCYQATRSQSSHGTPIDKSSSKLKNSVGLLSSHRH